MTRQDAAKRMARARQWIAHHGCPYLPQWDELTAKEQEQAETEARHWIQAAANAGVKIVPAGCVVVELPEPDGYDEANGIWWWNTVRGRVERHTAPYDAEQVAQSRALAVAILAAIEHTKDRAEATT